MIGDTSETKNLPLSGLIVLDLTLARAGPTCVRHLADWGAEIIRIEPPVDGGEDVIGRRHGSDFQNLHRNKKAIRLDLKSKEGYAVFERLVARADVVVENMRAPVKDRLKVAWDDVHKMNPRVVYGSISGFGQTGPYREHPGYDFMIQGMGGMMSVTGEPDDAPGGGPQRAGVPVADIITGMYASIAICAAIANRAETGKGQHLDLALLDSQIALLSYQNTNYFATGKPPARIGNLHPNIVPYQPFKTSDGSVILACGNDNLFRKFCEVAGCTQYVEDARFATNGKRVENRVELTRLLQAIFAKRSTRDWVDALEAAGVPNGPINDVAQVFEEPQVKARKIKIELDHPVAGKMPLVASPMRFSGTPIEHNLAPPTLGQHTEEVLRALGKGDADIAKLRADGIV